MKHEIATVMKYHSHGVNQAGGVTLTMKARYDEIGSMKELLGFLSANITVKVKPLDKKPFVLGIFLLKSLSFDKYGQATVKLSSITNAVEMNRVSDIITMDMLRVRMEAEIDVPTEEAEI